MSRNKTRRSDYARREKPTGTNSKLFPNLMPLVEEITAAQKQFEQLTAENQRLQDRLNQQRQELVQAQQQATDLKAECESLRRDVELAGLEIERSHNDALVTLFKDMADERHNRLLRKLLAFDDDAPSLLRDLIDYLRNDLKLTLEGQVDDIVYLEDENIDHYELNEAANLPCQARIIGRGISLDGQTILRTEIELVDEEVNNGD